MADIFISYAREDRARTEVLADTLLSCGYSVWWDRQQVPGQAFDEVIEQQLEACKVVLVCWSDAATQSRWVKAEAGFALDHDKYVPIQFQTECKLPLLFRPYHAEDFSVWAGDKDESGFTLLVQALTPYVKQINSKEVISQSRRPDTTVSDKASKSFVEPEMMVIRAGSFVMGSDSDSDSWALQSEFPAHPVEIGEDFEIGVCPVSFAEYEQFAQATSAEVPDDKGWGREGQPVINVSWDNASAYCRWLAAESGLQYRLPTEAEWEYACRAGTSTRYWWGDDPGQGHANFDGSGTQWSGKQTSPLKSFKANPWGLYDTSGNVWEWVQDHWVEHYHDAPDDGSARLDADSNVRVLRGGSWDGLASWARSAARGWIRHDFSLNDGGFRLARTL